MPGTLNATRPSVKTNLPTVFLLCTTLFFCIFFMEFMSVEAGCQSDGPDWSKEFTPKAGYVDKDYFSICQNITEIPLDVPANAVRIEIMGNNITTLQNHTFSHLGKCTYMSLAWNRLQHLESKSLDGLRSLIVLHLTDNCIESIGQDLFKVQGKRLAVK